MYKTTWTVLLGLIATFQSHAVILDNSIKFDQEIKTPLTWNKILPHPSKKNHFYVYSKDGILTQVVNGKTSQQSILDVSQATGRANITLTAFTLHPNFHLKDLPGYQLIYTAHQESFNSADRLLRLPDTPLNDSQYDLVVTEWKLQSDNTQVDLSTKREIIRIASPEKNNTIQKISFNPYLKPWQDGFNAIHIVLNHIEAYKEIPLYSGAILRINPDKFGLRNYTIPENNPFRSNDNVANEIIAFGAKNITEILWNKRNNQEWFYIESTASEILLKKIKNGDNLHKQQSTILWQSPKKNNSHSIVWYEGNKLTDILYNFITLEFISGQWQVNSLNITKNLTVEKATLAAIPDTNKNTQLRLIKDNNYEVMLLNLTDKTLNQISQVKNETLGSNNQNKQSFTSKHLSSILWFIASIIVFILLFFTLKYIRTYDKEKVLVRKLYARFDLSHHNEQIDLYKRHQDEPSVRLDLAKIKSCRIILNEDVINSIDSTEKNIFNQQSKNEMQHKISLERRLKMIDNRARILIIELTNNKNNKYQICLYARRGNQRYTRIEYQECIIMLTNLCWVISENINPKHDVNERNQHDQIH